MVKLTRPNNHRQTQHESENVENQKRPAVRAFLLAATKFLSRTEGGFYPRQKRSIGRYKLRMR